MFYCINRAQFYKKHVFYCLNRTQFYKKHVFYSLNRAQFYNKHMFYCLKRSMVSKLPNRARENFQFGRSFPEGAFKLPVGSVADGLSFWRSTISLDTIPRTFSAGWRLCLECMCECIGVGLVFLRVCWRLDLSPMIMYAIT